MSFDLASGAINIPGPAGNLQARFVEADAAKQGTPYLAVICHPHPEHGGTMNNKVVTTLERTYRDVGVAALCFNFRGVGASEGNFAHGVGELEDLLSVVAWVRKARPEIKLLLAGFSFGSAIAAAASHQLPDVQHLTLVAPPVERYDYDRDGHFNCPVCVVMGDKDELVNAPGVYRWVEQLSTEPTLIRYVDAGHFFHGRLTELKADVSAVVQAALLVRP